MYHNIKEQSRAGQSGRRWLLCSQMSLNLGSLRCLPFSQLYQPDRVKPVPCTQGEGFEQRDHQTGKAAGYEIRRQTALRATTSPTLAFGLTCIVKCRVGGFWSAEKLAWCKLAPERYLGECPCRKLSVAETLEHLMLTCHK